jgi:hypothetical protein
MDFTVQYFTKIHGRIGRGFLFSPGITQFEYLDYRVGMKQCYKMEQVI